MQMTAMYQGVSVFTDVCLCLQALRVCDGRTFKGQVVTMTYARRKFKLPKQRLRKHSRKNGKPGYVPSSKGMSGTGPKPRQQPPGSLNSSMLARAKQPPNVPPQSNDLIVAAVSTPSSGARTNATHPRTPPPATATAKRQQSFEDALRRARELATQSSSATSSSTSSSTSSKPQYSFEDALKCARKRAAQLSRTTSAATTSSSSSSNARTSEHCSSATGALLLPPPSSGVAPSKSSSALSSSAASSVSSSSASSVSVSVSAGANPHGIRNFNGVGTRNLQSVASRNSGLTPLSNTSAPKSGSSSRMFLPCAPSTSFLLPPTSAGAVGPELYQSRKSDGTGEQKQNTHVVEKSDSKSSKPKGHEATDATTDKRLHPDRPRPPSSSSTQRLPSKRSAPGAAGTDETKDNHDEEGLSPKRRKMGETELARREESSSSKHKVSRPRDPDSPSAEKSKSAARDTKSRAAEKPPKRRRTIVRRTNSTNGGNVASDARVAGDERQAIDIKHTESGGNDSRERKRKQRRIVARTKSVTSTSSSLIRVSSSKRRKVSKGGQISVEVSDHDSDSSSNHRNPSPPRGRGHTVSKTAKEADSDLTGGISGGNISLRTNDSVPRKASQRGQSETSATDRNTSGVGTPSSCGQKVSSSGQVVVQNRADASTRIDMSAMSIGMVAEESTSKTSVAEESPSSTRVAEESTSSSPVLRSILRRSASLTDAAAAVCVRCVLACVAICSGGVRMLSAENS